MRIGNLKYKIVIAETGSLNKAGKRLNYSLQKFSYIL